MAAPRYDLTPKVQPFLDPLLFRKIEEFNGASVAPLQGEPATEPASLETAQKLYEAGKFLEASKVLSSLKFDPASDDYESQVWGKFAAEILAHPEAPNTQSAAAAASKPASAASVTEEETAAPAEEDTTNAEESTAVEEESDTVIKALLNVQDLLDQRRSSDSTSQLNRRAWLIHWSLFAYFNGRLPKLVDTFFMSPYMSVVQAACPWIIRYVVVAVVATHPRSSRFNRRVKDVIRVVQQELYEYTDPVLEFVRALYVDFDLESVASKINEAAKCLENDFFAHTLVDQFVDSARVLTANSLLRVHEYVTVADASKVLGFDDAESAKKWISEYIAAKQEAKLDASYDESKQTVRVTFTKPSVNSQILEKVKAMDHRANQLQQAQAKKTEA